MVQPPGSSPQVWPQSKKGDGSSLLVRLKVTPSWWWIIKAHLIPHFQLKRMFSQRVDCSIDSLLQLLRVVLLKYLLASEMALHTPASPFPSRISTSSDYILLPSLSLRQNSREVYTSSVSQPTSPQNLVCPLSFSSFVLLFLFMSHVFSCLSVIYLTCCADGHWSQPELWREFSLNAPPHPKSHKKAWNLSSHVFLRT